ncbi:hypothetical protein HDV06_006110 [Boothiomyces sp. JEL0866]|nr:hypothetical protein HDV06_006110 [Boothiomyces sp. JEL0866]
MTESADIPKVENLPENEITRTESNETVNNDSIPKEAFKSEDNPNQEIAKPDGAKIASEKNVVIETQVDKLNIYDVDETNGQPQLSKVEFLLIFVGLFFAVFLAALDQTIIGIAIPAIAKDFQSLSEVSWLGTAFLLTSTAFVPSYGKFADIFGRKVMILTAVTIFEIGSIICGAATDMNMLIIGRAIAGLGGGGVFSLTLIIISDLVPIYERPKYQGLIGAAFGAASVAGPLLGGFLTDNLSWRWNFYINVPIGAFAIAVCSIVLRLREPDQSSWRLKIKRIDFIGTFFLILAVVALLIPIQGGGTQFAWNSPIVIVLLSLSAPLIGLLVYSQWKWSNEPIIPLHLFKKRYTVAPFISTFFLGMTMLPAFFYVPLYFQIVLDHTAQKAGIDTFPLVIGLVVFVISSGLFAGKTGYYLPPILLGSILASVGTYLMSTLDETSSIWQRIFYLFIPGVGIGMCLQTELIACQDSVEEQDLSIVTALKSFWQSIGSVFGLAIASTYFNNVLQDKLREALAGVPLKVPLDTVVNIVSNNPLAIRSSYVPAQLTPVLVHAFVEAIQKLFLICVPFGILTFVSALFINWTPLDLSAKRAVPVGE